MDPWVNPSIHPVKPMTHNWWWWWINGQVGSFPQPGLGACRAIPAALKRRRWTASRAACSKNAPWPAWGAHPLGSTRCPSRADRPAGFDLASDLGGLANWRRVTMALTSWKELPQDDLGGLQVWNLRKVFRSGNPGTVGSYLGNHPYFQLANMRFLSIWGFQSISSQSAANTA